MRCAIDRFRPGSEKEVYADEFEGIRIVSKHNRFFCPECGETVFFRSRGGNHPNHFVHRKKTDTTPECEKRVDGQTRLTLIQHVGLPLFLTRDFVGKFCLCMGFPALGSDVIDKAEIENCYVSIECANYIKTEKVDHISFVSDRMTLLPIDFVPNYGENYRILLNSSTVLKEINAKWSDYSDGFGKYGAVFESYDQGGKKIRCGGNISTNKEYTFVSLIDLNRFSELNSKLEGNIKVGEKDFGVYSVRIDTSASNAEFKSIYDLLIKLFDVWLLECAPEIIPLWPPVVEQELFVPITNESIICSVSSGNDMPSVYVYSTDEVSKKKIEKADSGRYYLSIFLNDDPVFVSVDRKYVGREIGLCKREIERNDFEYDFRVLNDGEEYRIGDTFEKQLQGDLSIIANSKCEMYIEYLDSKCQFMRLRKSTTERKNEQAIKNVYFYVGRSLVWSLEANNPEKNEDSSIDYMSLENEIRLLSRGVMVDIPGWAVWYINEQKLMGADTLYYILVSATRNGQIYREVLKRLSEVL